MPKFGERRTDVNRFVRWSDKAPSFGEAGPTSKAPSFGEACPTSKAPRPPVPRPLGTFE